MLTPTSSESRGRKSARSSVSIPHGLESPDVSPTDRRRASGLHGHRKALAVLGADQPPSLTASNSTSSLRPAAAGSRRRDSNPYRSTGDRSWSASAGMMPDYNDGEISPSLRPGTGFTFSSEPSASDRRPSAASTTTISSEGSKASASKFRKRLQGFFGDEYQDGMYDSEGGGLSRYNRPASSDMPKSREKTGSDTPRHLSEGRADQPRPEISPEITPWMYQSFDVSCQNSVTLFFFFFSLYG